MDRVFVYPQMLPQDTDILSTNRNMLVALGMFALDVFGSSVLVASLPCNPGSGLTVSIGAGRLYSLQNVDNAAYGTLPSDTANHIVKQGINLSPTTLSVPAPGTSGFSVNYLIQAQYQDSDTPTAVLGYFNSTPPYTPPLNGPSNSGTAQPTARRGIVALQAKVGTAAATGTQTTPAADAGWTGLFSVTVANGQSSIVSGNITQVAGAPFITESLTQKISQTTADARYLPVGVYSATFDSGPVQYIGPGGHLAGNNNVIYGNIIPNPTGVNGPCLLLGSGGGAGVPVTFCVIQDQAFDNVTPGNNLIITSGETQGAGTADGGNLTLYGGASFGGSGGTTTVQGGTSANGRGGPVVIRGGAATGSTGAAIPGDVFIEGGDTGKVGSNVHLVATQPPGAPSYGVIRHRFNSNLVMDEYSDGSLYLYLGNGFGLAGQPLLSGGPGNPCTWGASGVTPLFTGTITTAKLTSGGTNGSMTFSSGILVSQTQAT